MWRADRRADRRLTCQGKVHLVLKEQRLQRSPQVFGDEDVAVWETSAGVCCVDGSAQCDKRRVNWLKFYGGIMPLTAAQGCACGMQFRAFQADL